MSSIKQFDQTKKGDRMPAANDPLHRQSEDEVLETLKRILGDGDSSQPQQKVQQDSIDEMPRAVFQKQDELQDDDDEISAASMHLPSKFEQEASDMRDDDDDEEVMLPRSSAIKQINEASTKGDEKKKQDTSTKPQKKKSHKKLFLGIAIFLFVILGLVGGAAAAGYYAYQRAQVLMAKMQDVQTAAQGSYDALKGQNLIESKNKLKEAEEKFQIAREEYNKSAWVGSFPYVGLYYKDGEHAMNAGQAGIETAYMAIESLEPYADVLGFTGEGTFAGGGVDQRIKLALETLDKVMPIMDKIQEKLDYMNKELSYIDEQRYPVEVKGIQIRSKITKGKLLSKQAAEVVKEGRPVLEVLPKVAGADGKRKKYLILFQNDKELRPTGGFLTAYAFVFVENGVVTQEKSDDIYEIDKNFRKKPEIPAILKKFLTTEKRWNLRDMNISPDFKTSMDTFWENFLNVPGQPHDIDGIIALDTHVLENLVQILGPVEVPGYGTFSAEKDKRCDCAQIIYALSEIIDRPTPYLRENRKGILGPMMSALITKAYGAPKQQWPTLFEAAWKNIQGKHVQFYFLDEKTQAAAETVNAAGRVQPTPENSDYLFIVDANLGGAKSNMFVESSVEQDVELPENGMVRKTVTITYKNPFPPSNCNLEAGELCLNGTLNDWFRVYLPKGAQIEESLGFDADSTKTYEEFDHAVVEGSFTVQPMGQAKIKLTYTVPYTDTTEYRVFIQKQGGTRDVKHMMRVNGGEEEITLDADKTVKIAF